MIVQSGYCKAGMWHSLFSQCHTGALPDSLIHGDGFSVAAGGDWLVRKSSKKTYALGKERSYKSLAHANVLKSECHLNSLKMCEDQGCFVINIFHLD